MIGGFILNFCKCMRRYLSFAILLFLSMLVFTLTGCGERKVETKDASASYELIEDEVEIPADGIIKAEQFEAFAGTDRVVSFKGRSGDIQYVWMFPGRNIHNAIDEDLSIDFVTAEAELQQIREISGNAPLAIGMKLKGTGLVTVPTLAVTLPEVWDADVAVYCKEKDGTALKLADAGLLVGDGKTVLTMKITEVGDTYYVVAGLSPEAVAARDAKARGDQGKDASPEDDAQKDEHGDDAQKDEHGDDVQKDETVDEGSAGDQTPEATVQPACTISISCATILDNMDKLEDGKEEFVPANGLILAPTTVTFNEGDSVFDVLLSVCQTYGIHMEHAYTPVYGSEYIEGINQLYEFDCGELSGWMFSVDGWFPNYGCDKYILSDGETIQWVYSCDLGRDVGDNSQW